MKRLKNYLRPFLSLKFLLCFFIAWMFTNGWSYVFIIVGTSCKIQWLTKIGAGYQAFLWLPLTPEKLVTIPIAMWFNTLIFRDEKTNKLLLNMKLQAQEDWSKIKSKFKRGKSKNENNT